MVERRTLLKMKSGYTRVGEGSPRGISVKGKRNYCRLFSSCRGQHLVNVICKGPQNQCVCSEKAKSHEGGEAENDLTVSDYASEIERENVSLRIFTN